MTPIMSISLMIIGALVFFGILGLVINRRAK
jgi:hypothetical protein